MDRRDWLTSENPQAMLACAYHDANPAVRRASDRKLKLWVEACRAASDAATGDTYAWSKLDDVSDLSRVLDCWCESDWLTKEVPLAHRCHLLREIIGDPWEPLTIREEVPSRWPGRVYVFQPTWLTPSVLSLARVAYDQQDWSALGPLSDALEEAGCSCQLLLMHLRGWEVCPYCMGTGGFQANSTWVPCEVCDPNDTPSDTIGWRPLRTPHARGCWAIDLLLGQA